jgi:molecular chaperone DnaK (HSP70)
MSAPRARFLVGIDLGTINSALAFADLAGEGDLAASLFRPRRERRGADDAVT